MRSPIAFLRCPAFVLTRAGGRARTMLSLGWPQAAKARGGRAARQNCRKRVIQRHKVPAKPCEALLHARPIRARVGDGGWPRRKIRGRLNVTVPAEIHHLRLLRAADALPHAR